MKNTDHVVMSGQSMLCKHCRETSTVKLPTPITEFVRKTEAFITLHQDCQPSPTKETPL